MDASRDNDRAIFIARSITQSSSQDWPRVFEDLRRRKRLSDVVRRLNQLLEEPAHRELAKSALKRFGLDHAG
jgi:hypothetical protein